VRADALLNVRGRLEVNGRAAAVVGGAFNRDLFAPRPPGCL
jgi:hypothetical protein